METKIYYILGTVFLISSGFIYTFERVMSNCSMSWGQGVSMSQSNVTTFTMPLLPSPFSNIFITLFITISVIFFVRGYAKNKAN